MGHQTEKRPRSPSKSHIHRQQKKINEMNCITKKYERNVRNWIKQLEDFIIKIILLALILLLIRFKALMEIGGGFTASHKAATCSFCGLYPCPANLFCDGYRLACGGAADKRLIYFWLIGQQSSHFFIFFRKDAACAASSRCAEIWIFL